MFNTLFLILFIILAVVFLVLYLTKKTINDCSKCPSNCSKCPPNCSKCPPNCSKCSVDNWTILPGKALLNKSYSINNYGLNKYDMQAKLFNLGTPPWIAMSTNTKTLYFSKSTDVIDDPNSTTYIYINKCK
jgi:hypothetical protein